MSVIVTNVIENSMAESAGIKKGDVILSINNNELRDIIDYLFYSQDSVLRFKIRRGSRSINLTLNRDRSTDIGLEIKQFRIRLCRNKCIFCFVHQLPKGMRKSLYVKDDDYRMSFLFGNYITLTNLTRRDKERISEQRLSPLYISVHATDNNLRRQMLGNSKVPDIIEEIQYLVSSKIRMHVQIVVCPGINDGEHLRKTINDLQKFYPYVSSIAVVPVGLTKYYKGNIRPVQRDDALRIIECVKYFRRRLKRRHGDPMVYLADEFYLKAGLSVPGIKEYGDFPQIENGVGMISYFLNSGKNLKIPKKINSLKIALITGVAFSEYLEEFVKRLRIIDGLEVEIFSIKNRFFGDSVTVAGLLTGKDIVKSLIGKLNADVLFIPDVMLKHGSDIFLDDVSLRDLGESLGIKVKPIESTPEGIIRGIRDEDRR